MDEWDKYIVPQEDEWSQYEVKETPSRRSNILANLGKGAFENTMKFFGSIPTNIVEKDPILAANIMKYTPKFMTRGAEIYPKVPTETLGERLSFGTGYVAPDLAMMIPAVKALKSATLAADIPALFKSGAATTGLGLGGYEALRAGAEARPQDILPDFMRGVTTGAVLHGAGRVASTLTPKFVPFGERVASGVAGAGVGAMMSPNDMSQSILLGTMGATFPGTRIKGVEKVSKGIREVPGKVVRTIAETPAEQAKFLKETIRKEGVGSLFGGNVEKAPYINDVLAPEAHKIYIDNLTEFTPEIQKIAQEQYKIPKGAIDTIKNKGYGYAERIRNTYNDSTDPIYQGIQDKFVEKENEIDSAYNKAYASYNKPDIEATPFWQELQKVLRDNKYIDLKGTPTTRYKSGLNKVYDELTNMYLDMRYEPGEGGTKVSGHIMAKNDFLLYRDKLNQMLKDAPSDINVLGIKDALFNSAEKSGMKGIQAARDLENIKYTNEEKFLNSPLLKEKGLDRYQSFTEQQKRDLEELENYLGYKFKDDLNVLTSAREMDKLAKFDKYKLGDMLSKATNVKEFNTIKEQLAPYLGKDTDRIMNQVRKYTSVQYVSPKGAYPSRAGLLKGAARYGLRGYYENVYPFMSKFGGAK